MTLLLFKVSTLRGIVRQSPSTISYELSRCQPYQAELAQTDAEYK